MEKKEQSFELKPYMKKELRAMYGVSKHVFNKLLNPFKEEIGLVSGKYLTVNQVQVIIDRIGIPKRLTFD